MKPLFSLTLTLAGSGLLADSCLAQPPQGGPRPRNNQQPGPGSRPEENGPGGQFRLPPSPLVEALDGNKDGVISAEEIEKAVAALKSLDKNKDGKLTEEEIRPQFPGSRPEGGPQEGNRPPRPEEGNRPQEGNRPPGDGNFLSQIMENDKNKDGKLTKEELPEQMQRMLERGDEDKDGALSKSELEKMMANFRNGGNRPGGNRQPGGPGENNTERPARPQRPQEEN